MRTLRLQSPPDSDRIDRDPREPFQPPREEDPEETPYDPTREEPVDDPVDSPGHDEPERRDPLLPDQPPGGMEVSV